MSDYEPYNPLDKRNLAASVAEALLEQSPNPLGAVKPFVGAGIYAIYYVGTLPCYKALADRNRDDLFEAPIYVGKAVPQGARKGKAGLDTTPGTALSSRLKEHADTIRVVENLDLRDFFCRFLVVDDTWIPLAETLLIATFSPIWNQLVDGFGNHDPGAGRYKGMRPRWDVLHPGRAWAVKCKERSETAPQIAEEIAAYLRHASIPTHPKLLGDDD